MSQASGKIVLVIEDDRNTADLIALYLEREGFKPVTAGDGEAGLALAEQYRPDLVVLDLMLPKIDGWEVCRRLRQKSEVPVIMLTARGEEIDRVAGLTLKPGYLAVFDCRQHPGLQPAAKTNGAFDFGILIVLHFVTFPKVIGFFLCCAWKK